MKELLNKIAIIFIAVFLLLMNIPPNLKWNDEIKEEKVDAAAPARPTGSSGSYLVNVSATPVTANPSVYWTQLDNLSFEAVKDGGKVPANNSGNNTPIGTVVTNSIDLTKYNLPSSFKGTNGLNYTRQALTKMYLKNNSVTFKTAKSFEGVSLVKKDDTTFKFTTKTGEPKTPTSKEKYGVNFDKISKYKVRYDTPVEIFWYGEVLMQAEVRVVENSKLPVGAKKNYKLQLRTKEGALPWTNWNDTAAATWSSDKKSVATVSSTGQVTAVSKGTAKITATWIKDNYHLAASAMIDVTAEDALSVTGKLDACFKDGSTTLKATLYQAGGKSSDVTSTATWTSSDTSVATVSKGVVTFKKVGSTTIKVTSNGKTESVKVTTVDCTIVPLPTPTDPSEPPPPPPPPSNDPPTVVIEGPKKVVLGELVCYDAIAEDPDGFIELYEWDEELNNFDSANKKENKICGKFKNIGDIPLIVHVQDNGNELGEDKKWGYDVATITVVAPQPTAYVNIDGTLKENRRVTAQPYDPYNGNTEAHKESPIVKHTLTIESLDDENKSKLFIEKSISGNVKQDELYPFLGKFSGDVKITSYVENSLGDNDTFETVITLIPDEVPIVDFDTPTLVYREKSEVKGQAPSVDIELNDFSYSVDDEIQKRIWRMKYDSDNDDIFDDEEWEVISDNNERELKYNTNKVGKYLFELEGWEKIVQPTIPQFVDQTFNKETTDLRFNDTSKKAIEQKIVEVDNLAPLVSLDTKEKLVAEIQFDAINSPYTQGMLEGSLPYLKNLLAKENINLNLGEVNLGNRVKQVVSPMYGYALYLMEDGTVYGVGNRIKFGAIGDDWSENYKKDIIKVNLPSKVKQIATSVSRAFYLMEDGSVYGVGDNMGGELGDGTKINKNHPVKIDIPEKVSTVYSIHGSTVFITENGNLYRTGLNPFTGSSSKSYGERSDSPVRVYLPSIPPNLKVKQVALGNFADILMEDGSLYRLNRNDYVVGKVESFEKYAFLQKVKHVISDATFGQGNFYILEDGSAYAAGSDISGNLGIGVPNGTSKFVVDPVKVNLPSKVINISTSGGSTHFVLDDGTVYSTGSNTYGNLGNGTKNSTITPTKVILPLKAKKVSIQGGNPFFLMEDGTVYASGDIRQDLSIDSATTTDPVLIPIKVTNFEIYTMYSDTNATLFTVGLNQIATLDYYKRALKDVTESYFVGAGIPTNKTVFESVIGWNENRGQFINIQNRNVQNFYDDLAKYIVSVMGKKVIDVQYDITNSPYNESQLRSMNAQLNSLLNDYDLRANVRFKDSAVQTNQPLYSVDISNNSVNVTNTLQKLQKTNAYYVGGGTSTNKASMDNILSSHRKGTFIDIGTTYTTAQLETFTKELAAYIIQTQSDNSIEIEFLLDEASGINKATLESKINSVLKGLVAPNETITDYVQQADGTYLEVESTKPSSTVFRSKVTTLSNTYNFKDVHLDGKNRFVVSLKTNGYDTKIQNHIKATNLVNNAYFVGLGNSGNKGTINQIVQNSMKKGTFIEFNNLDAALNDLATFIKNTVDANRGINELFITTEDELEYFTTYDDYEGDPIFDDYWKFKHELNFFESETGVLSENDKKIASPIQKFSRTGLYQPIYAAQDDPLTKVFASEKIENFKNYRKWSDEADNWRVFVHKMPSSDFTFTINVTTGAYTVTNKAMDSDKASINVGYGAGLQAQSFTWKLEDDVDWQEGLPSGNLVANQTYQIRNTVIDLQGKKSETIKLLSRQNLPPVALFKTDKQTYSKNEDVLITNTSYDPNSDNLTATWTYKYKHNDDSTYKALTTGALTGEKANAGWNPTLEKVTCEPSDKNKTCAIVIQLVVTDIHGLSDSTTREITINNSNKPIADFETDKLVYEQEENVVVTNKSTDPDDDDMTATWSIKPKDVGSFKQFATGEFKDGKALRDWHTSIPKITCAADDTNESCFYIVKLVIVDEKGETDETTREIEVINNKPPVADFETNKAVYKNKESVVITNKSVDSDKDNMTAVWQIKSKNEPDSAYTQFATGEYKNNSAQTGWHPTLASIECPANFVGTSCYFVIKLTVTDAKGKTDFTTREIEVLNNKPPVAQFTTDKTLYTAKSDVVITNTSTDPDNDDMSAEWFIKLSTASDSSYKKFGTGAFTSNKAENDWNPVYSNITCPDETTASTCSYTIKLIIRDENGATDETTRTINVEASASIEVGVKSIEVYTAKAEQGLPVYMQLDDKVLINNASRVEEALDSTVRIDILRNGTVHGFTTSKVSKLLDGLHFSILPTGLVRNTAYDFTFVITNPGNNEIEIAAGADKIQVRATTAEERIINSAIDATYQGQIVAKRTINQPQLTQYETIKVETAKLQATVTGLGHSLDQSFVYTLPVNQHYKTAATLFNSSSALSFDSKLIDSYYQPNNIVNDRAIVNTVKTKSEATSNAAKSVITETLSYPKIFVEKNTGYLFSEMQKNVVDTRITQPLIDGGHKLYTPIWLDQIGTYDISYVTGAMGVNKVSFTMSQDLKIEAYMFLHINSNTKAKDKFLLEPVNKKLPFPNGKPAGWSDSDVEWLKN